VAVVPATQTLLLWDASGRMQSAVQHSIALSITQIQFASNMLLTSGNVLAWWKLPRETGGNMRLIQALEFAEQCGEYQL
jgi:hypothetical protein